jgi:phosphoglucosamine mutase
MRTDKRYFGTDGIRGRVGLEPITPEFAIKLGWAIGQTFRQAIHDPPTILIGKDTRLSGNMLEAAVVSGLLASGAHVQSLGILPTPGLAYLMNYQEAHAGIMITASHNGYMDNGFKCFSKKASKFTPEIQTAIEQKLHHTIQTARIEELGTSRKIENAQTHYLAFCQGTVPDKFSLDGKKIVLDCAQGATYQIAPRLFESLGAQVIPIGHQPNGLNSNLGYGTTHPETLQQYVLQEKAELGIAFDGDGDRVIMVDHTGAICNGDDLLFILAKADLKHHRSTHTTVVGTIMSNRGLELALRKIGIDFICTPVGDRYIYDALEKINGTLGGEPSGHIICSHLTPTADGLIAALQVLVALKGTSLYEARATLYKFPQYIINVPVANPEHTLEYDSVKQAIKNAQHKLKALDGRLVVRASGTESMIRIMVEGTSARAIQEIAEKLAGLVLAM